MLCDSKTNSKIINSPQKFFLYSPARGTRVAYVMEFWPSNLTFSISRSSRLEAISAIKSHYLERIYNFFINYTDIYFS